MVWKQLSRYKLFCHDLDSWFNTRFMICSSEPTEIYFFPEIFRLWIYKSLLYLVLLWSHWCLHFLALLKSLSLSWRRYVNFYLCFNFLLHHVLLIGIGFSATCWLRAETSWSRCNGYSWSLQICSGIPTFCSEHSHVKVFSFVTLCCELNAEFSFFFSFWNW